MFANVKCLFLCYPDKVQPVCLTTFGQRFRHGTKCWTSGFGTTVAGSGKLGQGVTEFVYNIGSPLPSNCSGKMEGYNKVHMLKHVLNHPWVTTVYLLPLNYII